MLISQLKGHPIIFINNEWLYIDTKQPTVDTWKERPCFKCGRQNTQKGHDACLGTLPGIMNACCGHGTIKDTYVQFLDGVSIHGESACIIIKELKKKIYLRQRLTGG